MSQAVPDAVRFRRAATLVVAVAALAVGLVAFATWGPEGIIVPLALLPIAAGAGALAGFILAGTIWYAGLPDQGGHG